MKLLRALDEAAEAASASSAAASHRYACWPSPRATSGMQPGGDLMAQARTRELPVYSVDRSDGKIAISFDAAWGAEDTPALLDILDEYGVKDHLLPRRHLDGKISGNGARKSPRAATRSKTIPPPIRRCPNFREAKIIEELRVNSDRIEQITGVRPTLFRPPYGDYNDAVVRTSRAQGYECVQWNVDSLDWKNRGVDDLIERATKNNAVGRYRAVS